MKGRYTSERARPTAEEIAKRERRIADAVKAGVSPRDIYARFDIGEDTLRKICARQNVRRKAGNGRRWA